MKTIPDQFEYSEEAKKDLKKRAEHARQLLERRCQEVRGLRAKVEKIFKQLEKKRNQ